MNKNTRAVETVLDINAPVEAVWKAITEAENLTQWFPPDVEKGEDGHIKLLWKDTYCFSLQVTGFELYKSIQLMETPQQSSLPHHNEEMRMELHERKAPVTVDIKLTGTKGGTTLKLVHSGFGNEPHWDDVYESAKMGWGFELRGLRHYLENHAGTKRNIVWIRKEHKLSMAESWKRITSVFKESIDGLKEHDHYSLHEESGESFEGNVHVNQSPTVFAGTLTNLNNSVLRFFNERIADKGAANFWISAYGVPQKKLDSLQKKWQNIFDKLYE